MYCSECKYEDVEKEECTYPLWIPKDKYVLDEAGRQVGCMKGGRRRINIEADELTEAFKRIRSDRNENTV